MNLHAILPIVLTYFGLSTVELVPENIFSHNELPYRYRSMESIAHAPNLSGSGRFTTAQLQNVRDLHPGQKVWVLDLRRESHYFSQNGNPYSFYGGHNDDNADIPLHATEYTEQTKNPDPVRFQYERDVIQALDMKYLRLPITDHTSPTENWLPDFLGEMLRIPKEDWIHVHCRGGVGRTTTVMMLIDMLKNRHLYTFDEYIERQIENGGKNLKDLPSRDHWKYKHHVKRLEFLRHFYEDELYGYRT